MALRVLLADESSTIKKVFQLALQDFGVEVRSVNIGVDVASVARSFKPDILFADVLLQKKNGYDVCAEIKGDAGLKSIPVVLMWSGFMELDEDKFQASQANEELEKPFDVAALRKLITDLVPRTKDQKLSQFLTFPKTNTEPEAPAAPAVDEAAVEAEDDFQQVSIPKIKGAEKYRLELKPEELDPQDIPVEYEVPLEQSQPGDDNFNEMRDSGIGGSSGTPGGTVILDEPDEDDFADSDVIQMPIAKPHSPGENRTGPPESSTEDVTGVRTPSLSSEQLEKVIRAQSAEVIEAVVWKVVPELAKQIIERELNRLLQERDSHPY